MVQFSKSDIHVVQGSDKGPRIGHLIAKEYSSKVSPKAAIIGFPCDIGVRINNGRVGAAMAPDKIREQLYMLTPDAENADEFVQLMTQTFDLGNLVLTEDINRNQDILAEAVCPYIEKGVICVILGGGHETSFGHFLGYVKAKRRVSILNWDAHPDVRPLKEGRPHSGSPFRQALEHSPKFCSDYTVAGLLPHCVDAEHIEFINKMSGSIFWRKSIDSGKVKEIYQRCSSCTMVSFDIDAVDQAFAPGVSAPACGGLSIDLWLQAAYLAGQNKQICSFDITEVNPQYDRDNQTSRLAALTIWHFFKGLCSRLVFSK